jgi:hypothetical protein
MTVKKTRIARRTDPGTGIAGMKKDPEDSAGPLPWVSPYETSYRIIKFLDNFFFRPCQTPSDPEKKPRSGTISTTGKNSRFLNNFAGIQTKTSHSPCGKALFAPGQNSDHFDFHQEFGAGLGTGLQDRAQGRFHQSVNGCVTRFGLNRSIS